MPAPAARTASDAVSVWPTSVRSYLTRGHTGLVGLIRLTAGGGWAAILALLSLMTLELAVMLYDTALVSWALPMLLLSVGLTMLTLRASLWSGWHPAHMWWVAAIVVGVLANLFYMRYPRQVGSDCQVQLILILSLAVAAATAAAVPARKARIPLACAVVLWLGLVAVSWPHWGSADIDVFTAVTGAAGALLHGGNPYAPLFAYTAAQSSGQFGWLSQHFVYGPIVPLLASPGWLLGDIRVMSVAAVLLTVLGLWVLARQGGQADSAHRVVALALAMPFAVAMIQEAWVEVYTVAGVIWWLALRPHRRKSAIACLAGAMLVTPLTFVLLVPAFLWSHRSRVECLLAGCGAAVFALPFALVSGVGNFVYDVAGAQLAYPPRYDSLNLTAYAWDLWGLRLPIWLPVIVMAATVAGLAIRSLPHHMADLGIAAALMLFAACIVAKQGFPNYYYIAIMMTIAGLATAEARFAPGEVSLPVLPTIGRCVRARRPRTAADEGSGDEPQLSDGVTVGADG